jgi:hypothetical protein
MLAARRGDEAISTAPTAERAANGARRPCANGEGAAAGRKAVEMRAPSSTRRARRAPLAAMLAAARARPTRRHSTRARAPPERAAWVAALARRAPAQLWRGASV